MSKEEFDRRRGRRSARGTILPFLRRLRFAELDLERAKDADRDVDL